MSRQACLLCGSDTAAVSIRIVEWSDPIDGRRFEALPRCRDRDTCWSRVTVDLGEDWPIADGRPIRAPAQPEPAAETPEAVVEDPTWLMG